MNRLLFFCGIWILALPNSKENITDHQKSKITGIIHMICMIAGCDSVFIALNALCNFTNQMNLFLVALYAMLMLLNVYFAYKKMYSEKGKLSKIIVGSSGVFWLVSIIVILLNFEVISFACVLLTAVLIVLSTSNEEISYVINGD